MTGRQGSTYDLSQARHRFYAWAACRAAQAGSAKATRHQLMSAIEASGVAQAVYQLPINCQRLEEFDALHDEWVLKSIFHLKQEHGREVSYGVAAKLIAVYLKGAYVLHSNPDDRVVQWIHPPIDSLLLKGLDKEKKTQLSVMYKWQRMDSDEYHALINTLRRLCEGRPFWQIEAVWDPGGSLP